MEQIFKSVLLLSAVGTVLSVALLLLKPITKRVFGSRWQYYIWLCVLVVMMLPVSFKMPVEMDVNITAPQVKQAVQENNNAGTNINTEQTPAAVNRQTPIEYHNIDVAKGITLNLLNVMIYIWLIGVGIFFCGGLISYLRFLGTIRKNSEMMSSCPELEVLKEQKEIKRKISVRTTELLTAPLMVGIFKPTLLLPNTQMSEAELYYILQHELTHLKRNDLWYKWFAMLVNAVHWFNPLVYVVTRQINEECEISCDLSVTRNMSEQEKNGYMNTILSLLSTNKEKSKMLTTAMASDKNQIKRRFMMIKDSKKASGFTTVISIITAVMILSATVFASGVLANTINNSNGIEVRYDGKTVSLWNTPFVDNEEIYLPLREVLNNCSITNDNITYDSGKISFTMYSPSVQALVTANVNIGESGVIFDIDIDNSRVNNYTNGKRTTTHSVMLKNGVTYVPLGVFIRIKDLSLDTSLDNRTQDTDDSKYIDDFRYSRATKYNLLQDLEIRKYHDNGNYDIVLSLPLDIKGENNFLPDTYYGEKENVFIGTVQQQEEYGYHHKEVNYFHYPVNPVKRILVDDDGNVLAIVPVQNQKHEVLDRVDMDTLLGHPGWRLNSGSQGLKNSDKIFTTSELICDSNPAYQSRMKPCFFIPTDLMVIQY